MTGVTPAAAWLRAMALTLADAAARAQPAPPPVVTPNPAVIHPRSDIDPGMKVAPKRDVHMPTPVIKPHPDQGNTVVVPK